MSSFTELLQDEREAERLSAYAIKENPSMKNFEEFEEAFLSAFEKSPQGKGVMDFLNDEESKMLFETNNVQRVIKENSGKEYEGVIEEFNDSEVIRAKPKGEPTDKKDITIIYVPKNVKVKSYQMKNGREIKPYVRSFNRWNPAMEKFIQVRKAKGVKPAKVVSEFNSHFKNNQRTESSIKTKYYRT